MHDAKFEGGEALVGVEPFRQLFRAEQLFDRVFERPAGDRPAPTMTEGVPGAACAKSCGSAICARPSRLRKAPNPG